MHTNFMKPVLYMLLVLVMGCTQKEPYIAGSLPSGISCIKGKVTDTEEPPNNIAGAIVTYERESLDSQVKTVVTDSEGNYEIPNLLFGVYAITVSKAGYNIVTKRIEVAGEVIYNPKLHVVRKRWYVTRDLRLLMLGIIAGILSWLFYSSV